MAAWGEHAEPGASAEEAGRRETVTMLLAAIRMCTREDAAQVMSAELERIGAGMPGPAFLEEQIRADAAWWADMATPLEAEAYVAAGLRRIERTAFCEAARKRIFATMWESFSDADRKSFMRRVDPQGQFRGKSR